MSESPGSSLDPSPFESAAAYYDRFRAPYAEAALAHVLAAVSLGPDARVLDLGCGPGKLAIPLSHAAGEVVAVDPSAEMLAEGRALAAARGAGAIRWVRARAEDLPDDLGVFRLATMGLSFHWMDRDRVLARLVELIEPGGLLAILEEHQPESWERLALEVAGRFLGPRERNRAKHPERDSAPSLRRSAHFAAFEVSVFPSQITRDLGSILGCVYSWAGASKPLFGDRAEAFEAALAEALLAVEPTGLFHERTETTVILARRAATPA